ncbi:MAG TPA: hypothetical protein VN777_15295 [Terriglobales bacterium]|nr:hypothetical protein [Terriglobales bacterium]
MRIKRSIAVLVGAVLLAPGMALAAPQCFQLFSGVYVLFEQPVTDTTVARNGRVWGALSSCDGLSSWPVVGNSYHSKTDGTVVAFRAFTVDATTCGATDWIGTMSGKPLSGPFELWNQRTNFGNTGTWTEIKCPTPPEHGTKLPAGVDPLGNIAK